MTDEHIMEMEEEIRRLKKTCENLATGVKIYKQVLHYYAAPNTYDVEFGFRGYSPIEMDKGKRARAVLNDDRPS